MPRDDWRNAKRPRLILSDWERGDALPPLDATEAPRLMMAADLAKRLHEKAARRNSGGDRGGTCEPQHRGKTGRKQRRNRQSGVVPAVVTVQGRRQIAPSVWELLPPYAFDKHPVPTEADLAVMFGSVPRNAPGVPCNASEAATATLPTSGGKAAKGCHAWRESQILRQALAGTSSPKEPQ